jgi:hypothetical protein
MTQKQWSVDRARTADTDWDMGWRRGQSRSGTNSARKLRPKHPACGSFRNGYAQRFILSSMDAGASATVETESVH